MTVPTISIRRLSAADVRDYRTIRLSALETAPEAFSSTYAAEASLPIRRHIERLGSSLVFGAYDGARIVGVVGFRPEEGERNAHKGFVWGFYVDPLYRQRGVGAALMSALLGAAGAVVEQVLLSVVETNADAIAFYERLGFACYGVEPRALGDGRGYVGEVLMVRFLHRPAPSKG